MASSSSNSFETIHGLGSFKKLNDAVFEVYKPATGAVDLELVFFHGFQSQDYRNAYVKTWMVANGSACWLNSWLPERFPRSRILSVSYDSSTTVTESSGEMDIYIVGENLAKSIIELAGVGQTFPVVLVGHCEGGMVLKEVCRRADRWKAQGSGRNPYETFLSRMKGVFFYSPPLMGSRIKASPEAQGPLVEYFKLLSNDGGRLNTEFSQLRRRGEYRWKTFGIRAVNETEYDKTEHDKTIVRKTNFRPQRVGRKHVPVVEESSARCDMDEFCVLEGEDNTTVCNPKNQSSSSYRLLVEFVQGILDSERIQALKDCALERVPLRHDVVALGYEHFNCPFRTQEILCIYRRSLEDKDAVEIIFFHVEGMAMLFGVGVPFAKVVLREKSEVEVREIGKSSWERCWMESRMELGTAAVIYSEQTGPQGAADNKLITLASKGAADCVGVGAEGMNFFISMEEDEERIFEPSEMITPLEWIGSLLKVLNSSTDVRSTGDSRESSQSSQSEAGTSSSSGESSGERQMLSQFEMFNVSRDNVADLQLDDINQSKEEEKGEDLQLTVRIFLDSNSQNFASRSNDVEIQTTTIQVSRCNGRSGYGTSTGTARSSSAVYDKRNYQLSSQVVIQFSCKTNQAEGHSSKRFKSTLELGFNMKSCEEGTEYFGWYQNNLEASFKCSTFGAAVKETTDLEKEFLSQHELRPYQMDHGTEDSKSAMRSANGGGQVGLETGARLGINLGLKKDKGETHVDRTQTSTNVRLPMLQNYNFLIQNQGQGDELAYKLELFPDCSSYGIWNSKGRGLARGSGMMSSVPIHVTSEWTVIDGANVVLLDRFCKYEFLSQRNLYMHQRIPIAKSKNKNKEKEITLTIDQNMSRTFYINHSFSHMHRLKKRKEYIWRISENPEAPYTITQLIN